MDEKIMSWFITFNGRQAYPLHLKVEDVLITDIAHSLSRLARFQGHFLPEHYSVAEHSVLVSHLVPKRLAFHGLMHDAAEAYCGDVITPIKQMPGMAAYRAMERRVQEVIREKFGMARLSLVDAMKLRRADMVALLTEKRDLIVPHPWPWDVEKEGLKPSTIWNCPCLSAHEAKAMFLSRFYELR